MGISVTNRNYKSQMGHAGACAVKECIHVCGPDSVDAQRLPPVGLSVILMSVGRGQGSCLKKGGLDHVVYKIR